MTAALLVIGALLELGGIIALGFPDLLPGALRLSAWLRDSGGERPASFAASWA